MGLPDSQPVPQRTGSIEGCSGRGGPPAGYRSNVTETLRLTIAYDEPDEDGWIVARVIEIPGAISQGRTPEDARANVIDALRLMLAPDDDDPNVAAGRSEPLELILSG